MTEENKPRRKPGRPIENPMPPRINDCPENIARVVLSAPPPKESDWRYLKRNPRQR